MAKPLVKDEEMDWQKLAREKSSGEKIKEVTGKCLYFMMLVIKFGNNLTVSMYNSHRNLLYLHIKSIFICM